MVNVDNDNCTHDKGEKSPLYRTVGLESLVLVLYNGHVAPSRCFTMDT